MLTSDINPSTATKAHFSSFYVFLLRISREIQQWKIATTTKKKEAYYCKHVTALFHKLSPRQALLGGPPSTCQVLARDYSITFQQEPRSFEIRKNKQYKMCQRGSPGTLKWIFLGDSLESAYHCSEVLKSKSYSSHSLLFHPPSQNLPILKHWITFMLFQIPVPLTVRIKPYVHKSGVLFPKFH